MLPKERMERSETRGSTERDSTVEEEEHMSMGSTGVEIRILHHKATPNGVIDVGWYTTKSFPMGAGRRSC
jgi:hypothetical protein